MLIEWTSMLNKRLVFIGIVGVIGQVYLWMMWIFAPPEATFGEYIRIFFQHIGPALTGYLAFGVTLISSGLYLWKRELKYDIISAASIKLGLLFNTITLLSGMVWANATWGVPWNWDPRETTTLILWIAYACLLVYRASVSDREMRAQYGSIFGIIAFPSVILSYFSTQIWFSLHPQLIKTSGLAMGMEHGLTMMFSMVTIGLLYVLLLDLTYHVESAGERLMEYRMSRS